MTSPRTLSVDDTDSSCTRTCSMKSCTKLVAFSRSSPCSRAAANRLENRVRDTLAVEGCVLAHSWVMALFTACCSGAKPAMRCLGKERMCV